MNSFRNCIYFILIISSFHIYAKSTPKFSLIPSTPTKFILPINGDFTVKYTVTNNTNITRTLTMVPIQGIIQDTTASGSCANPFTLRHNESCTLKLNINGNTIPILINKGPVICKTNSTGNTPDPFLCSQPSLENSLNITRGEITDAVITATPTNLAMIINSSNNSIAVTNQSLYITAEGISMPLPIEWTDVSETDNCSVLRPLSTCYFNITTGSTLYDPVTNSLGGGNTNEVKIILSVVGEFITVTPSTISIPANDSTGVTVTITNTSTTRVALNVSATSPWSDVTLTKTGCDSIAPSGTCTMKFVSTSSATHGQQPIYIKGDDTNTATLLATVTGSSAPLNVTPPLSLLAYNFTPQPITIQNQSTTITATNVHPSGNGHVIFSPSSCGTLTPQQTCTISVIPQVASTGLESISVSGTDASTESVNYQIITYGDSLQDGLIFAMFNTIPLSGLTAMTSDASGTYIWATPPITSPSIPAANHFVNGAQNSSIINSGLGSGAPANYTCVNFTSTNNYGDWFLPAGCQIYPVPNGACGSYSQNMYNSLFLHNTGNFCGSCNYWSSTYDTYNPPFQNHAFAVNFNNQTVNTYTVSNSFNVRCVRNFTPNTI